MQLTQEEKQIGINLLLQATVQVQDTPRVIGIIKKLQAVEEGDIQVKPTRESAKLKS